MDKFVNRTQDTKKMKNILKTQNRVHIISSTAGTGKSSLILHVLGTYMTNRFITVESDELFFVIRLKNGILQRKYVMVLLVY